MREFFSELRRRNVFKVATVYVVVGWGVIQAADVLFPALTLPKWTVTLVVALVFAGFPISLMLAWAFELTPSGIARDTKKAISTDTELAAVDRRNETAPVAIGATTHLEVREQRSLAVLPFVDMSPGHDHEYFADGLAEELLDALARVADLRVPSRTSCFAFKGKDVDVAVVAERLRVSHVLEGSVRRSGERIRIAAKLVETSSDTQLWSEIYDRQIDDIFVIQSDIARQIVSALQLRLRPQDTVHATTRDASAYELYLRGLSFLHRFGPKNVRFAIDMLRRATELDPRFAKAWAGLAKAHATLAIYYSGGAAELQASDEASCRSMELAPGLAEAHTARGVSLLAQKRYDEAAAQFEFAVKQNPRSFDAWYQHARTALHQGALEKALELFERRRTWTRTTTNHHSSRRPSIESSDMKQRPSRQSGAVLLWRKATCRAIRTMHARTFSRPRRSTTLVSARKRSSGRTGPLRLIETMPLRAIMSRAFMRRWEIPTRHWLSCRAP